MRRVKFITENDDLIGVETSFEVEDVQKLINDGFTDVNVILIDYNRQTFFVKATCPHLNFLDLTKNKNIIKFNPHTFYKKIL